MLAKFRPRNNYDLSFMNAQQLLSNFEECEALQKHTEAHNYCPETDSINISRILLFLFCYAFDVPFMKLQELADVKNLTPSKYCDT